MLAFAVSGAGLHVYRFDDAGAPEVLLACADVELASWSDDGKRLVAVRNKPETTLLVYAASADGLALDRELTPCTAKIVRIELSPRGNYAAICGRYESADPRNFRIVDLDTGDVRVNHSLGNYTESFPPCQWSDNETFLAYQLTGQGVDVFRMSEAHIGPGHAPWQSLKHDGMSTFLLGSERGASCVVATASKKVKGKPGVVKVVDIFAPNETIVSTSFFNGDSVSLSFNHNNSSLIAVTHADVDASGQSYYGQTTLYLLPITGPNRKAVQPIPEGRLHDFCWSPTENVFAAIHGEVPPKVNVYDGTTGKARFELGTARRNTLCFSKCGRLLLSGGFGNMAGLTDVWDMRQMKVIGSNRLNLAVLCSWAPNGLWFSCCAAQRVRVENGFRIVRYNGEVLSSTPLDELSAFKWRPAECDPPVLDPKLKPVGYGDEKTAQAGAGKHLSRETNVGTARDLSRPVPKSIPGMDAATPKKAPKKKSRGKKKQTDEVEEFAFAIETPTF